MTAPVKRGPGRPRKVVPEPAKVEVVADEPAATAEPEKTAEPVPSDPYDPRIGRAVHRDATQIGFDDGCRYRVEGGLIMEKLT